VLKSPAEVVIFADDREAATLVVAELRKLCAVQTKRLEVADFLLSDDVAVEKKTISDFLQSLIDGRLFSQLAAMKDNFEKPLLIIEGGDGLFLRRAIHPNAIRGALAAIALDYGVPIIWTADEEDTAATLFVIAKREQLERKRSVSIRGKRKVWPLSYQQKFLVAGLPSVSTVLAERLLRKFKTPARVFAASELALTKVEGIGEEKAKRIREILESEYAEKD